MAAAQRPPVLGSLALIAIVIGLSAALFAYTAGWFSPRRLTPDKVVAAFSPPNDSAVLGHRRNHAKGICFTGVFEANGAGSELSKAAVFVRGEYPVLGRFNLATPNPNAPDATVRVRGLGMQISNSGRTRMAERYDCPPGLHSLNTTSLLRTVARVGEQGP